MHTKSVVSSIIVLCWTRKCDFLVSCFGKLFCFVCLFFMVFQLFLLLFKLYFISENSIYFRARWPMAPVDGSLGPLPPLPLHLYIRLTLKGQSLELIKTELKHLLPLGSSSASPPPPSAASSILSPVWPWGHIRKWVRTIEEESDRREDKGRRCWLGDRIYSIPCRTRDLAPRWFEKNYE